MAGYDPKIFIRDYGNATYNTLAYNARFKFTGHDAAVERHLILEAENPTDGIAHIALEGDATDGDDILLLEGDEAGNSLILENPALFRFTGHPVEFLLNLRELFAEAGNFTFTGHPVDFLNHFALVADNAAFSFVGHPAQFGRALVADASHAGFTFTGHPVTMTLGYKFSVDPGAFAFTGHDIGIERHLMLEANHVHFTTTFWPVEFVRSLIFAPDNGGLTFTGHDVSFFGRTVNDEVLLLEGDAQTTGWDALILEGDEAGGYLLLSSISDLVADHAGFVFTGHPVQVDIVKQFANAGFTFTGHPVQVDIVKQFANAGLNFTGHDVFIGRLIEAENRGFNFTGHPVTFELTQVDKILLEGDAQVSGNDVLLLEGDESGVLLQEYNATTTDLGNGGFTFTGHAVTIGHQVSIALEGDAQLTGNDVLLLEGDESGNLLTENA